MRKTKNRELQKEKLFLNMVYLKIISITVKYYE